MQKIIEYVTEQCRKARWGDDRLNVFLVSVWGNSDSTLNGVCDIPGCNRKRTSLTEFNFRWGDYLGDGDYSGGGPTYLYVCPQHYSAIRLEAENIDYHESDQFS
jgi:hypothetical protein